MNKAEKLRKKMDKLMEESVKARNKWKAADAERMRQYQRHMQELHKAEATDPDID